MATLIARISDLAARIAAEFKAVRALVPAKASGSDFRSGTDDSKFQTAKSIADGLVQVSITPTAAASGLDFSTFINATINLTGNLTLGAPTNTRPGVSGVIGISQDVTGGRTLAFNAAYRLPSGGVTLQATASGVTFIPYLTTSGGAIRIFPPAKWG